MVTIEHVSALTFDIKSIYHLAGWEKSVQASGVSRCPIMGTE